MIKVSLVRPEGCLHCVAVRDVLQDLKKEFPALVVEEIDIASPRGQELKRQYNILSTPGIFVNDELFAFGNATREQFREKFRALTRSAGT